MKKSGIELIAEERQRQIEVEKFDLNRDEDYNGGELIGAAGCYAANAVNKYYGFDKTRFQVREPGIQSTDGSAHLLGDWKDGWPWGKEWDKRKKHDMLRSLVIAGALIAAEIDRLQIVEAGNQQTQQ